MRKPAKAAAPPDPAVLARIEQYSFEQAVKDARQCIAKQAARGVPISDDSLRSFISFHWPDSAKRMDWADRVIAEARKP